MATKKGLPLARATGSANSKVVCTYSEALLLSSLALSDVFASTLPGPPSAAISYIASSMAASGSRVLVEAK